MARPRTFKEDLILLSVKVPEQTARALQKIAETEGINMSFQIRRGIDLWLKSRAKRKGANR